jgi:hypothetical protein
LIAMEAAAAPAGIVSPTAASGAAALCPLTEAPMIHGPAALTTAPLIYALASGYCCAPDIGVCCDFEPIQLCITDGGHSYSTLTACQSHCPCPAM